MSEPIILPAPVNDPVPVAPYGPGEPAPEAAANEPIESAEASGAPSLGDAYAAHSRGRPFWFGLSLGLELVNTGNAAAKFIIESETGEKNPYGKAIPIIGMPNFSHWRVGVDGQGGFSQKQDAILTGVEITNATITNIAGTRDLFNPQDIRTDDMAGFAFLAVNNILEPSHEANLYRGMIASQQDGAGYRLLIGANAGWGMVLAGARMEQIENTMEIGCSPWKSENFPGGPEACDEYIQNTANGSDAVLSNFFGNGQDSATSSPDLEGLDGIIRATQQSAKGQYRTVYGMGAYALFDAAEINGRPSLFSLAGAAPLIAEGIINAQMGQPLTGGDWAERGAVLGGAFALTAISDEAETDVAIANNYSYMLISPNYPGMIELTTLHNDILSFGNEDYDNPNSAFMYSPAATLTGYSIDSSFAGFQSGYAIATGDGVDRYAPLALNVGGLGLQTYINATEGNPHNWKYIGLGTALSAAGVGVGYAAGLPGKNGNGTWVRKVMQLNPRVSVDPEGGASVGISGRF